MSLENSPSKISLILGRSGGLEALFLLNEEGPTTKKAMMKKFREAIVQTENLRQILRDLEEVGAISQEVDNKYSITEKGKSIAEKLIASISAISND